MDPISKYSPAFVSPAGHRNAISRSSLPTVLRALAVLTFLGGGITALGALLGANSLPLAVGFGAGALLAAVQLLAAATLLDVAQDIRDGVLARTRLSDEPTSLLMLVERLREEQAQQAAAIASAAAGPARAAR